MTAKEKGARRERKVREWYENAGYMVQPFYGRSYGETDGFGLFDLVAKKRGEPVRFIQVKSNRASGIREWCEKVSEIAADGAVYDFVVVHDREGVRLLQPTEDGHTAVCDERDSECNMGDDFTAYLP